ncbi:serine-rich adhesin for platelets-like [Thunnus thynnus]|uniref:serine-rich adhesin for platelets-like n=1 Tax=Thunnus thynnus TaxID=8237 RepID=UPI0035293975
MEMKSLLFGVILGLFAAVHSTPVNAVTQIPIKAEDDVYREVVEDEFLVDQKLLPSLTTEPPKRNTTVQASHPTPSDSEESDTHTPLDDMIESNAAWETSDKSTISVFFQDRDEHYETTSTRSTSTVLPRDTDVSTSDSPTTQSPQSGFTSSSMPTEDYGFLTTLSSDLGSGDGEILDQNPATSSTTTPSSNTETRPTSLFVENEGSGLGSEPFLSFAITSSSNTETRPTSLFVENEGSGLGSEPFLSFAITSSSTTETSTASSTFPATTISSEGLQSSSVSESGSGLESEISKESRQRMFSEVKEPHKVEASDDPDSHQHKGHNTPDWIIILGFVVGVAALVIICAAIATRDKWNGPNQLKTKTNSSDQQREVEMDTFLHKDMPRENGKATEYTVIPLEELPEKYSH